MVIGNLLGNAASATMWEGLPAPRLKAWEGHLAPHPKTWEGLPAPRLNPWQGLSPPINVGQDAPPTFL